MKNDYELGRVNSDLSNLIKAICERPRMYVGDENFGLIASFIDGFAFAHNYNEIREFSFWIGVKFKKPRNVAWFCNLKEIYPNDEDILRKLPSLFDEFCNTEKDFLKESPYWKEEYNK